MATREIRDPMSLIGNSAVQPLRPPLSRNLIPLYGLQDIAASVARFDPVTGEKINRLRKSYANYPKDLGLAGKNKQIEHHESLGLSMTQLVFYPDEEWHIQRAAKAPVGRGWEGISMSAEYQKADGRREKLTQALTFTPAKLPPTIEIEWGQALGHEKSFVKKPKPGAPVKPNGASPSSTPNAASAPPRVATPKPSTPATGRPQRKTAGQKRGYDDEVYDFNGGASDGNSSDTGSQHGQRKKYKGAPPARPSASASYGPGSLHR